jgi:hypothetical protein
VRRALLRDLVGIAHDAGMTLTTCAQPRVTLAGVPAAHCIDVARLTRIAGREIASPAAPRRAGCGCAKALDIGGYGTCRADCAYCYARRDRPAPKHDPTTPGLSTFETRRALPLFDDEAEQS